MLNIPFLIVAAAYLLFFYRACLLLKCMIKTKIFQSIFLKQQINNFIIDTGINVIVFCNVFCNDS